MNSEKTVLGLLAGIATGALLGILFAPDSGKNTRDKIVQKGEGYADDVKDKFDSLLDGMKARFESLKQDAEEIEEKGKAKLAEKNGEFKNALT
jgi:gas vesicle protein